MIGTRDGGALWPALVLFWWLFGGFWHQGASPAGAGSASGTKRFPFRRPTLHTWEPSRLCRALDSLDSREEPSPRKPNKANPAGRSGQQLRHHPATKETRPARGAARLASPPVRLAFDCRCRRRGILLGSSQKRYSCIPETCSRAESASFVLGPQQEQLAALGETIGCWKNHQGPDPKPSPWQG